MKTIKRRYVYSALALPFIAFGIYTATLPPMDRGAFISEFLHKTVVLFTGEPDVAPDGNVASGDSAGGAAPEGDGGRGGGPDDGRRGGGGGRFDPAAIFADRDADGDGKLTGDEISDRMRENMDQIDTDQDGSVTLEEFQARMQQMFANRGAGGDGPGEPGSDRGSGEGDPGEGASDRPQRPETE